MKEPTVRSPYLKVWAPWSKVNVVDGNIFACYLNSCDQVDISVFHNPEQVEFTKKNWEIFALPVWNCDWFELHIIMIRKFFHTRVTAEFGILFVGGIDFPNTTEFISVKCFFCIWFLSGFCCRSDLTVFQPSQEKLEQQLWIWTWPCKKPSLLNTGVCNKRLDEKTQH